MVAPVLVMLVVPTLLMAGPLVPPPLVASSRSVKQFSVHSLQTANTPSAGKN
jgi:hypothetical protein